MSGARAPSIVLALRLRAIAAAGPYAAIRGYGVRRQKKRGLVFTKKL